MVVRSCGDHQSRTTLVGRRSVIPAAAAGLSEWAMSQENIELRIKGEDAKPYGSTQAQTKRPTYWRGVPGYREERTLGRRLAMRHTA
jgi:hypothetical protein